jgi:hypothetical protein
MRKYAAAVPVVLACLVMPAAADTITHKSAQVKMELPDGWKSERDGETLTLSDKAGDVGISMVTVDDTYIHDAIKNVKKALKDKISKLTFTEPKKQDINGMNALVFDGDGFLGDTNVDLAIVVLDAPPKDKDLLIIAIAADEALAKHKHEIIGIFDSIKPAH